MSETDEAPTGPPPRQVVEDWTSDYDIFDAEYITDPYPIWADLRNECPVAHTERWGGSWLPTRYEDVVALARMVPALSSQDPIVVRPPEADQNILPGGLISSSTGYGERSNSVCRTQRFVRSTEARLPSSSWQRSLIVKPIHATT